MRATSLSWTAIPLVLAALAGAMAVRYLVIEPASVGLLCDPGTGPWWCSLRAAVVVLFGVNALGYLSLGSAVRAHMLDWRGLAMVALVAGAAGLVLYNADLAAAGFVIGLLRAARS